jgi:hypothetical protein
MERRRFVKTAYGMMEWLPTPPAPPLTELQRIALATRQNTGGHSSHAS